MHVVVVPVVVVTVVVVPVVAAVLAATVLAAAVLFCCCLCKVCWFYYPWPRPVKIPNGPLIKTSIQSFLLFLLLL